MEVQGATTVTLPGRKDRPADSFKFDYDRVYRMANPGRQMFAEVVQPLLAHFLQGFNTTVSCACSGQYWYMRACKLRGTHAGAARQTTHVRERCCALLGAAGSACCDSGACTICDACAA